MIYLQADDETLLKDLSLFVEPVEISDANGQLLGLFVPANLERGKQLYARAIEGTDWAEMERRGASGEKGKPLWQVYEHLLTLTDDPKLRADLQKSIDKLKREDQCATP